MRIVSVLEARNIDGGFGVKVKCSKCGCKFWGLFKFTALYRFNEHKRTAGLRVAGLKSYNPCQYASYKIVK